MQKRRRYLVFISHSTEDRWIARQIASAIEGKGLKYGLQTFLDEKDIEGGDLIPESVRKNVQECDELLVLLSPHSVNRQWVLVEIGAAWALEKRIVAILDKVTPNKMPDIIRPCKCINLNGFDAYLEELLKRAEKGVKEN